MATQRPRAESPAVTATANVHLWGHLAGQVLEFANGRVGFSYDQHYLTTGRALSPKHLPLEAGIFEFPELRNSPMFLGLPGVLADSLPDAFGNKIIQSYFESRGEKDSALSPVQRLLYVGRRAMGALEYTPALQRKTRDEERALEVQSLVEAARKLIEGDASDAVNEIMRVGGSAGGARAKALILWDRERRRVRSGFASPQAGEEAWIIKFDGVGSANVLDMKAKPFNRIEYTYALLARQLGIEMSEVAFLEDHGLFHFMTKRFDRNGSEKLHMHSLGGITHVDYNLPQAFSYEAWFRLMLELQLGHQALEQAYKRMVFNIVGRNQDDHVKNISFLLDSMTGEWRLAPAYDLNFAAGAGYTARHQMTLGGKTGDFTRALLLETGAKFSIRHPGTVIDETVQAFAGWGVLAAQYGVPPGQISEVEKRLRLELKS
ncbi:MAG: type II toxin-antitoxin system HipA family toxin [Pseudomonadota bacterium]